MTDAVTVFDEAYDADPHGVLAGLRQRGPIHRVGTPDGPPAWLLTGYAEVHAALGDPRLALSQQCSHGRDFQGFHLPPAFQAHLLNTDPPQHTKLRQHIAPTFTAARVRTLGPGVAGLARRAVDDLDPTVAPVDLVAELAVRLPIELIADLLPLAEPARGQFAAWARRMLRPNSGAEPRARDTLADMVEIIRRVATGPAHEPSLLADLRTAHDGGQLDDHELTAMLFYLTFVWYEIAVNAIATSTLRLLTIERRDGEDLAGLVEEALRCDPPQWLAAPRFARRGMEIAGVSVAAGDTVLLSLAAANRDPAVFADPDAFDPARRPNPHVSLGRGIHACPAAALTRLLLQESLRALVNRYPVAALAVPASALRWRGNFRHRGPAELPVTLR